jgi:hypothetical protein
MRRRLINVRPLLGIRLMVTIAVALSFVNLGLLLWQVWPEGSYTPPPPTRYERLGRPAPSGDFRSVTEQRIGRLERQLSDIRGFGFGRRSIDDLSREVDQLQQSNDSLRRCVNDLKSRPSSGRDYYPLGGC